MSTSVSTSQSTQPSAWDTYRRRATAVREIVDQLDRTGADEPDWNDATAAVFADPDDLLVALHDLWTRRLEARVEFALDLDQGDVEESIAIAWTEVAASLPGVRRVLDRHQYDDCLRRHEVHEHRLIAVAAGLATVEDPMELSARAGARFVERIRTHVAVPRPRPTLRARLVQAVRA